MLYHIMEMLQEQMGSLRVFSYVNFRIFLAILTAMIISFVLGPWMIRKLQQLQIGQNIREEGPQSHQKKAGTPTMGGLLILAAIIIPTLLWANLSNPYIWILVSSTLAFGLIGFLDDFLKLKRGKSKGLGGKQKIGLQLTVTLVIGFVLFSMAHPPENDEYEWGDFTTQLTIPFTKQMDVDINQFGSDQQVERNTYFWEMGWLFIPFVVVVIVGASNAVNLTDGLDGLAIGASGIAGGTYTIMAYLAGNTVIATYLMIPFIRGVDEAAIFGGAIVGASLGFLWWNCFPAGMFMGDVGSLSLGGAIGTLAVIIKQEILLVIVGFLFVMEAVSVILQVSYYKLTGGKRMFRMAPIHHHFELKGWSEPKVITRFLILAVIFAMIGLSSLKIR